MQDFAGIGVQPGAAIKLGGIGSFETANAEGAARPIGPLAEFDEPGGLAFPRDLAVTLHVVIGLESGKKKQGHFRQAATFGSNIRRSFVRGVAAFIQNRFVAVLLKHDDIIVNLGAESHSEGLVVLGAVRDVLLSREVLKIVHHGAGALTGSGEHGRQIARGRRRYTGNGRIQRRRIPNEAAALEFFLSLGRLRR